VLLTFVLQGRTSEVQQKSLDWYSTPRHEREMQCGTLQNGREMKAVELSALLSASNRHAKLLVQRTMSKSPLMPLHGLMLPAKKW
jgi:hypothetical protein